MESAGTVRQAGSAGEFEFESEFEVLDEVLDEGEGANGAGGKRRHWPCFLILMIMLVWMWSWSDTTAGGSLKEMGAGRASSLEWLGLRILPFCSRDPKHPMPQFGCHAPDRITILPGPRV
jgi:hypothetical protein